MTDADILATETARRAKLSELAKKRVRGERGKFASPPSVDFNRGPFSPLDEYPTTWVPTAAWCAVAFVAGWVSCVVAGWMWS
jgi:hypothetical protein